jgi:predicted nucleic acid-binding protein
MQVFDASSMIYAWDNYPLLQFPGLWKWITIQIEEEKFVIPSVAFEEVDAKTPECGEWLKACDVQKLQPTDRILLDALRIQQLIGIENDKYHPKGVGANDLIIIATARAYGAQLISDEGRQTKAPNEPSRRKIPSVCSMSEVSVSCINFIELIKSSDQVF